MSGAPDVDAFLTPKHSALLAARQDADVADRRAVTECVIGLLEEDRRLAFATRQPATALSATLAIGRILGVFDDPAGSKASPVVVIIARNDAGVL